MIEFQLKETPPSKNTMEGSHWGRDQEVRQKWNKKTCEAIMEQVDKTDVSPEAQYVLLVLMFWTSKRERDTFNYADEGVHGIQDGIVDSQLLEDDNYKYIKGGYVQHGFASNADHTTVRLIPIEEWVGRLGEWVQP